MGARLTGKPGEIGPVKYGTASDPIGDVVAAAMDRQGISMFDLARRVAGDGSKANSTRVQLTYWIRGERFVKSDLVARVLSELQIDLGTPLMAPGFRKAVSAMRAA